MRCIRHPCAAGPKVTDEQCTILVTRCMHCSKKASIYVAWPKVTDEQCTILVTRCMRHSKKASMCRLTKSNWWQCTIVVIWVVELHRRSTCKTKAWVRWWWWWWWWFWLWDCFCVLQCGWCEVVFFVHYFNIWFVLEHSQDHVDIV